MDPMMGWAKGAPASPSDRIVCSSNKVQRLALFLVQRIKYTGFFWHNEPRWHQIEGKITDCILLNQKQNFMITEVLSVNKNFT
jgi:hypothetical protein